MARRREEEEKKEKERGAELAQVRVTLTCFEFCSNLWREFSSPISDTPNFLLTKKVFCILDWQN